MPELPDVETLARRLRRRIRGRRIGRVRLLTPSTVRHPDPDAFRRRLRGRRITDVRRRGKYLLFELTGDLTLAVHLRMTGDFELTRRQTPIDRHTRVIFSVNGSELRFTDLRRFGHMDLLTPAQRDRFPGLRRLGIEPLGPGFTLPYFRELIRARRRGIKALLLRQDLIAGIGNLYADEILWQARLHPSRDTGTLPPHQIALLHRSIRRVLDRAVRSLSRYRRPIGDFLDARERNGHCPRDHGPLRVARIAGRTTYFCHRCQR
jgi:formamidopyrimidine-DNA glycosylase